MSGIVLLVAVLICPVVMGTAMLLMWPAIILKITWDSWSTIRSATIDLHYPEDEHRRR